MADQTKKGKSDKRLNDDERFKYIGFEVFPGKTKDLFKNDGEKKRLEEIVTKKRAKGEILREDCQLMVERVSMGERVLLSVACLIIIAALFFPFYSVYSEIEEIEEVPVTEVVTETDSLTDTTALALAGAAVDPENPAAEADEAVAETADPVGAEGEEALATTEGIVQEPEAVRTTRANVQVDDQGNEIITGLVQKKKYHREFERVSGLGSLIRLGSLGSYLFSSGFILMLTAVLFLIYTLACLALPGFTLYSLYGTKTKGDDLALKLKQALKLSWIPVALFAAAIFLSFFGAEYGFSTTDSFTSIGQAYGTGVLLDSMSYGIMISLGGFIILAAKGSEI